MMLRKRFKDDIRLLSSENSDNPRAIGSEIRVLSARPKDCNFEARSEVTCSYVWRWFRLQREDLSDIKIRNGATS